MRRIALKSKKFTPLEVRPSSRAAVPTLRRDLPLTGFKNIFHIDAYRIKNPRELIGLGFREIAKTPQNTVLIEWADRVKKILPRDIIWLRFRHGKKENHRTIKIDDKI